MPIGAFKLNGIAKYSVPATVARTAATVTAFNQAKLSSITYKFGGCSAVFDGNNDYLTATTTASDSSGALTLEAWVRFDILPSSQTLGGGSYMLLATIGSSSYVLIQNTKVQVAVSGAYYDFTIPTVAINTWYHLAVVRESNNDWFVYWDGVKKTGVVNSGDTDVNKGGNWWADGSLTIGKFIDTRGSWDGFIDEFRLSKSARYTATFTPTTAPFVNDSNTVLLLHMDGFDSTATFTDDVGSRTMVLPSDLFGGQISTTQKKFGTASWYQSAEFYGFQYNSGSTLPDNVIGTGDYTIEGWVYRQDNPSKTQATFYSIASTILRIYYNETANTLIVSSGGTDRITGGSITLSTWTHIAITRSSGSLKLFINGTQSGSTYSTDSVNFGNATTHLLGVDQNGTNSWVGYLDEIRVSKIARYTANFTPSTTPFINDSDTIKLHHMDGTNASTLIVDDNN